MIPMLYYNHYYKISPGLKVPKSPGLKTMAEPTSDQFIELTDFWLSLTRQDYPSRGFGKWSLFTEEPHRLYRILEGVLKSGALGDAYSMKTRTGRVLLVRKAWEKEAFSPSHLRFAVPYMMQPVFILMKYLLHQRKSGKPFQKRKEDENK